MGKEWARLGKGERRYASDKRSQIDRRTDRLITIRRPQNGALIIHLNIKRGVHYHPKRCLINHLTPKYEMLLHLDNTMYMSIIQCQLNYKKHDYSFTNSIQKLYRKFKFSILFHKILCFSEPCIHSFYISFTTHNTVGLVHI